MRDKARMQKAYVYARHDESGNPTTLHTALSGAEGFRRTRYLTGSSSGRNTSTASPTSRRSAGEDATQRRTRTDRAPADMPQGQRIEPRIDEHGFPAGPSSAYERLHGLGPEFGESGYQQPPARSRLRRIAMMAGVFVIGAGVGLAAAWWIHKPQPAASVSAVPSSTVRSAPAMPAADGKRAATVRGISPSELPYDGAPPPAIPSDPEPVAAQVPAMPEMSSGASAAVPAGERNSGTGEGGQEAPAVPPAAPPVAAQKPAQVRQVDEEPKAAKSSTRQGNTSVANAAPKRKSAARSDREIERIRRQVDEELKKKTDHGRAPNDSRPGAGQGGRNDQVSRQGGSASASVARVSATRASLARCDRKSNFIRRELCRWDVCKGSWGKNGCPSYQQQASTY